LIRYKGVKDMGATNQSFNMMAGETRKMNVTITDPSGKAINLSGATIQWVLKRDVSSPAIVQKTLGAGVSITDIATGKILIFLEPTDTQNLSGNYYHIAKLTDGLGEVSYPFKGNIYVEKSGI
jgi:hypothetical protein